MKQFQMDNEAISFEEGDTIMQAAYRAGKYIPHLCWHPKLGQSGACRVCVVHADDRMVAACTTRAQENMQVENRTTELDEKRRLLLQMLFVEGNHFCPGCEKSGDCQLQAIAAEMGMLDLHFEEFYPNREVDASHKDIWIDFNRCILCKLCVRASHQLDNKGVFAIGGYGIKTQLLINSSTGKLAESELSSDDMAANICPVGAILPKRTGFSHPIGERRFDITPIAMESRLEDDGSK